MGGGILAARSARGALLRRPALLAAATTGAPPRSLDVLPGRQVYEFGNGPGPNAIGPGSNTEPLWVAYPLNVQLTPLSPSSITSSDRNLLFVDDPESWYSNQVTPVGGATASILYSGSLPEGPFRLWVYGANRTNDLWRYDRKSGLWGTQANTGLATDVTLVIQLIGGSQPTDFAFSMGIAGPTPANVGPSNPLYPTPPWITPEESSKSWLWVLAGAKPPRQGLLAPASGTLQPGEALTLSRQVVGYTAAAEPNKTQVVIDGTLSAPASVKVFLAQPNGDPFPGLNIPAPNTNTDPVTHEPAPPKRGLFTRQSAGYGADITIDYVISAPQNCCIMFPHRAPSGGPFAPFVFKGVSEVDSPFLFTAFSQTGNVEAINTGGWGYLYTARIHWQAPPTLVSFIMGRVGLGPGPVYGPIAFDGYVQEVAGPYSAFLEAYHTETQNRQVHIYEGQGLTGELAWRASPGDTLTVTFVATGEASYPLALGMIMADTARLASIGGLQANEIVTYVTPYNDGSRQPVPNGLVTVSQNIKLLAQ